MSSNVNSKSSKYKQLKLNYFLLNVKIRAIDNTVDLTPTEYARVFKQFYLEFRPGKSSKQKQCILTTQGEIKIDGVSTYFGTLVQTTDINNRKWFNKVKKAIDPNFRVPDEYGANASVTEYIFFPQIHRFVYKTTTKDFIDPYSVRRYLLDAMPAALNNQYVIHVDVVTSNSPLRMILEAQFIRNLDIKINYSNNDFDSDLQKFVEEDLKAGKVDSVEIIAKHKQGNSIDLEGSKILRGALESSLENGEASARIIDSNGKIRSVKTKNYPEKIQIETNSDENSKVQDVFNKLNETNDH